MCGILLTIHSSSDVDQEYGSIIQRIRRRGPNSLCVKELRGIGTAVAGVLWLQGHSICPQPFLNSSGGYLLWNGDVYKGLNITDGISDTEALAQNLACSDPLDVFQGISGPYAFIYVIDDTVWFGRDYFGRHSLLCLPSTEGGFTLSSIGDSRPWFQVPADGLFRYSVSSKELTLFPWSDLSSPRNFILPASMSLDKSLRPPIDKPLYEENTVSLPWIQSALTQKFEDSQILEEYITHHFDLILSFEKHLMEAVSLRASHLPPFCSHCLRSRSPCDHPLIGVLFSGGLDSSFLTYALHRILPPGDPILLINVAFGDRTEDAPDRITGRRALDELRSVCSKRRFDMEEIDVSKEELIRTRAEERIGELLMPSDTVLDDSIGCALWFAARGRDVCRPRVLLVGSGADEQLGGYSRHRAVFNRDGWKGLFEEVKMEVDRISERNLGRDNRIISDHGVASRIPFLDEDVVRFLNQVPLNLKMDLNLRRGLGEKLLLRAAAYKAGLVSIATEPKRAIQFGSRIAKIENKKEKGSDHAKR